MIIAFLLNSDTIIWCIYITVFSKETFFFLRKTWVLANVWALEYVWRLFFCCLYFYLLYFQFEYLLRWYKKLFFRRNIWNNIFICWTLFPFLNLSYKLNLFCLLKLIPRTFFSLDLPTQTSLCCFWWLITGHPVTLLLNVINIFSSF